MSNQIAQFLRRVRVLATFLFKLWEELQMIRVTPRARGVSFSETYDMTKVKIEATVSKPVLQELRLICKLEAEKTELEDKVQPTMSHVLEMLLWKGIKAYKKGRKISSRWNRLRANG